MLFIRFAQPTCSLPPTPRPTLCPSRSCAGPRRLTSVGGSNACASASTLLSGFQLGPVVGDRDIRGLAPPASSVLRQLFQLRLCTALLSCSLPSLLRAQCVHSFQPPLIPGCFTSPCRFLQSCPRLCKQSLHRTLFSVKQSKHLSPARILVTRCQQLEAPNRDHLPGLCGPGQPADTASASHHCWSHEAPGQAYMWGSNLPEGSGQSF